LNALPGVSCEKPNGAFYVLPSCEGLIGKTTPSGEKLDTDFDFADYLLNDCDVVVVPGTPFGAPNHFRISYAVSMETLTEALSRIKQSVDKLV
jgi:aspartate aminotransferase